MEHRNTGIGTCERQFKSSFTATEMQVRMLAVLELEILLIESIE